MIACSLVGFASSVRSYAQGSDSSCSPSPDDPSVSAAWALIQQLRATKPEDREKAATALQAMGTNATKALAYHLGHEPSSEEDMKELTKAVVILNKMGSDIAEDSCVQNALLVIAKRQEIMLGLRLAAIDALGEINKYKGGVLVEEDNSEKKFEPSKVPTDTLRKIAAQVFAVARASTTPTPTPPDKDFYTSLEVLQDLQAKLVKVADQVNANAPPSKKKRPAFPKLADAKTLAASLKKIEVDYSDATKTVDVQKLKLEAAGDKTGWQFKTEAAYDLLSDVKDLTSQLDALGRRFTQNRAAVKSLVSNLARISVDANSAELRADVASALSRIFSKPPEKKPPEEATKQTAATKDSNRGGDKKEASKKESTDSE